MTFTIHREPFVVREIVIGGKVQPPPTENKQGRKTMADEKLKDETGVKKISQEPADKQGPIGTGEQKPPPKPVNEDVKVGEGEKNA